MNVPNQIISRRRQHAIAGSVIGVATWRLKEQLLDNSGPWLLVVSRIWWLCLILPIWGWRYLRGPDSGEDGDY